MKKRLERKLAKKAMEEVLKTGPRPTPLEWQAPKVKVRRGNIFANSAASKEFAVEHRGVFSLARKLIQEKFRFIEGGKIVADKDCKVAVQKAWTGKEPGTKNILTMRVIAEGKELFVKIASPYWIKANISGLLLADEFLRKQGYRFGNFNVRAIMPYKAATFKGVSYLATDFFRGGEVVPVSEAKNAKEIEKCIKDIDRELSRKGVVDAIPENAFYHPKTNTILLFDLMQTPR